MPGKKSSADYNLAIILEGGNDSVQKRNALWVKCNVKNTKPKFVKSEIRQRKAEHRIANPPAERLMRNCGKGASTPAA